MCGSLVLTSSPRRNSGPGPVAEAQLMHPGPDDWWRDASRGVAGGWVLQQEGGFSSSPQRGDSRHGRRRPTAGGQLVVGPPRRGRCLECRAHCYSSSRSLSRSKNSSCPCSSAMHTDARCARCGPASRSPSACARACGHLVLEHHERLDTRLLGEQLVGHDRSLDDHGRRLRCTLALTGRQSHA